MASAKILNYYDYGVNFFSQDLRSQAKSQLPQSFINIESTMKVNSAKNAEHQQSASVRQKVCKQQSSLENKELDYLMSTHNQYKREFCNFTIRRESNKETFFDIVRLDNNDGLKLHRTYSTKQMLKKEKDQTKRNDDLAKRTEHTMVDRMWKAYEEGIAVTHVASSKSTKSKLRRRRTRSHSSLSSTLKSLNIDTEYIAHALCSSQENNFFSKKNISKGRPYTLDSNVKHTNQPSPHANNLRAWKLGKVPSLDTTVTITINDSGIELVCKTNYCTTKKKSTTCATKPGSIKKRLCSTDVCVNGIPNWSTHDLLSMPFLSYQQSTCKQDSLPNQRNAYSRGNNNNKDLSCQSFDDLDLIKPGLDLNFSLIQSSHNRGFDCEKITNTEVIETKKKKESKVNGKYHYDTWSMFWQQCPAEIDRRELFPFSILGTSAKDISSRPHVLSPPLMESLREFLPYTISEDNFWMKFSLVRDGSSLDTLLQKVRGSKSTLIAIETSNGEVFGSFQSTLWKRNQGYFGNGQSFLWRMRQSRNTQCSSIIDQAHLESQVDVYPWIGRDNMIQYCSQDMIAVGGGGGGINNSGFREKSELGDEYFGLVIDSNLMRGTSSPCGTFGSPSLCINSVDGFFEVINLEVWTFSSCRDEESAQKMEQANLFLLNNTEF